MSIQDINSNMGLEGPVHCYFPQEDAKKIKEMRQLGIIISLFLCRTEDQPLPVEKGKYWLSADKQMNGPLPPGRTHLWINFENDEHLKPFLGLIDELVVDQSSVKFLVVTPNFIPRLITLLYPSEKAKLIFENDFYITYPNETSSVVVNPYQIIFPPEMRKDELKAKEDWFKETYTQGSQQYTKEFALFLDKVRLISSNWNETKFHKQFASWAIQHKFPEEKNPGYVYHKEACSQRQKLLEGLFRSVVLVENQRYPYETRYTSDTDCYFIAQSLKPMEEIADSTPVAPSGNERFQ
jgi:hypothetical protein